MQKAIIRAPLTAMPAITQALGQDPKQLGYPMPGTKPNAQTNLPPSALATIAAVRQHAAGEQPPRFRVEDLQPQEGLPRTPHGDLLAQYPTPASLQGLEPGERERVVTSLVGEYREALEGAKAFPEMDSRGVSARLRRFESEVGELESREDEGQLPHIDNQLQHGNVADDPTEEHLATYEKSHQGSEDEQNSEKGTGFGRDTYPYYGSDNPVSSYATGELEDRQAYAAAVIAENLDRKARREANEMFSRDWDSDDDRVLSDLARATVRLNGGDEQEANVAATYVSGIVENVEELPSGKFEQARMETELAASLAAMKQDDPRAYEAVLPAALAFKERSANKRGNEITRKAIKDAKEAIGAGNNYEGAKAQQETLADLERAVRQTNPELVGKGIDFENVAEKTLGNLKQRQRQAMSTPGAVEWTERGGAFSEAYVINNDETALAAHSSRTTIARTVLGESVTEQDVEESIAIERSILEQNMMGGYRALQSDNRAHLANRNPENAASLYREFERRAIAARRDPQRLWKVAELSEMTAAIYEQPVHSDEFVDDGDYLEPQPEGMEPLFSF